MEQDACVGRLVVSTLLKGLPPALDLTHYFDGQPEVDVAFSDILQSHPANLAAGSLGQIMARYGMAATTIVDVLASISRSVRQFQRDNRISQDFAVTLGDISINAPPTIARDFIRDQVVCITDLDEPVAERLLQWLYAVADLKPRIIPHYIFEHGQIKPGGCTCCYVSELFETWSYTRTSCTDIDHP